MASKLILNKNGVKFLIEKEIDTNLDKMIKRGWNEKMQQGHFRYNLEKLQTKQVGKFITQLNPMRATTRRKPDPMQRVDQQFSEINFNFTKARLDVEKMFQVVDEGEEASGAEQDIVIINVSPIEFGHCLLVPKLEICQPQHLTKHSIELALKMVASSGRRNFKMAFNSLCAYASVNHLHWHMYYLTEDFHLFLERAPVQKLVDECYELEEGSYPGRGFAFQISTFEEISSISIRVFMLVDFLTKNNIAHNVFITRGASFQATNIDATNAIRIYVWARERKVGEKDPGAFVIAVCELSGQLLIYNEEKFSNITELEISDAIKDTCEETFTYARAKVLKLFKGT